MQELNVYFEHPPKSFVASGASLRLTHIVDAAGVKYEAEAVAALRQTINKMDHIENEIQQRLDKIEGKIVDVAANIAEGVLNEDRDLIDERVQRFLELSMQQMLPLKVRSVYLHPSCHSAVESWLEKTSESSIEIFEDASILPGDCRVECDETGIVARLDNYLQAATAELRNGN